MRRDITTVQSRNARAFLACAFGLLLALILLAGWCGQAARRGGAAELRLQQQQNQLNDLLYLVEQAQTAQRGYLLMGEDKYLNPYRSAAPQVQVVLSALGAERDTSALKPLVDGKMQELAQTVALAKAGQVPAALALLRADSNLHRMAQIRSWVDAAQDDVATRLAAIHAGDERNALLFELSALLCIAAGAGLGWIVISGHNRQTRRLIELNAELNRIFTLSADILAVVDQHGQLLSLNPAWTQLTGRPAGFRTGTMLFDIVHPDDQPAMRGAFAPGHAAADAAPRQVEVRLRKADGGEARIAWRVVKLPEAGQFYAIGRDVTADRARDEQLRQSQKMQVVGQLTGGIAHDFNNLLTIIIGSLEMLLRDCAAMDDKALRRAEAALDSSRRAAALTQSLLAFARRQPLAPQTLDSNRLLTGMSEILHRTLGEHVMLQLICSPGLWCVLADGPQLENAILNLAVNARDAMPRGGHLTIETRNAALDETYAAEDTGLQPGDYVMIAVTDTGTGMTPEIAAQVFEPFFTTKPAGQGTGLGLAQVYGFINQSQGHVKIHSVPAHGTTVILYLPRLADMLDVTPRARIG